MVKRRFWYHVCDDRGQSFEVDRRTPLYPDKGEPDTPRLAVCPNVPNCFAARLFRPGLPVTIYRTATKCSGVAARGVWDAMLTGERWIIPPMRMERQEVISGPTVEAVTGLIWEFHRETKKGSNIRLRIAQLAIAWRELGSEHGKGNRYWPKLIGQMRDTFKISDPDEYIWEAMECAQN